MSKLIGDWAVVNNILNPSNITRKLKQVAERVGVLGASAVKRGIISGAPAGQMFTPLSDWTTQKKHSSKPLIDKGDLVGSVNYQVIDSHHVFIGVKKGSEANIAAVHEFGCTIPVTSKMRAYLHFQGIHLKATTQFVYIPPRPFLKPVLLGDEFKAGVIDIYINALKEIFAL